MILQEAARQFEPRHDPSSSLGHVKDLSIDDHPAVALLVMLRNLLNGILALGLALLLRLCRGELLLLELRGSSITLLGWLALGGGGLALLMGVRLQVARAVRPRELEVDILRPWVHADTSLEQVVADRGESVGSALVGEVGEEVLACRVTGDTTKDDAAAACQLRFTVGCGSLQQGRTSETVRAVHTTGELSAGKDTRDGLAVGVVDGRVRANLETAHRVVQHRCLWMSGLLRGTLEKGSPSRRRGIRRPS